MTIHKNEEVIMDENCANSGITIPPSIVKEIQQQKIFIKQLFTVVFMICLFVGIGIVGSEFTNNKIESASWIKIVSGSGVFWFSVYSLKIILKIK
jgi:hypothetical protein